MKDIFHKVINYYQKKSHIYLTVGILLFLIICFSLYFINRFKPSIVVLDNFKEDKLIMLEDKNSYKYMDSKGTEIDNTYLYASEYHFGYAIVSRKEDTYEFINQNGSSKMTIESKVEPKYYKEYSIWQIGNTLYDSKLKSIFNKDCNLTYIGSGYFAYMSNTEENSGIINSKGKVTFSWKKDYIKVTLSNSSKLFKKYAIISDYENDERIINIENGKEIFKLADTETEYIREEDNNIFRIIDREENYKTKRWLYILDDKTVFDASNYIYDVSLVDLEKQVLKLDYGLDYKEQGKNSQVIYYDLKEDIYLEKYDKYIDENQILIKERYNLIISELDSKKGLVKKDNLILDHNYNKIEFLDIDVFEYIYYKTNKQIVILKTDESSILYDIKHKNIVQEFSSQSLETFDDSTFVVSYIYDEKGYKKTGYKVLNLLSGNVEYFIISSTLKVYSNYITVTDRSNTYYYNTNMELIKTV